MNIGNPVRQYTIEPLVDRIPVLPTSGKQPEQNPVDRLASRTPTKIVLHSGSR
jgi:hypothetical protein